MEHRFLNKSWVWIKDLVQGQALNGKVGEVIGFDPAKKRYMIFIPDLDENGFSSEYLTEHILQRDLKFLTHDDIVKNHREKANRAPFNAGLPHKQNEEVLRKLFSQETNSPNIKLIKPENLSPYKKTDLIECQYVNSGSPFGRLESRFFPKEHPIFRLGGGNSPVFEMCRFPLIVLRYPLDRPANHDPDFDNQFGTYLLIGKFELQILAIFVMFCIKLAIAMIKTAFWVI